MFLGTFSELRVAVLGVLLAAAVGAFAYTHHEGYEACKAPQVAADKAQVEKDLSDAKGTIDDLKKQLAALSAPAPPPVLRLCVQTRSLRAQSSAPGSQPLVADAARASPGGVPEGTPGLDIGPAVSDLERAAEVSAIYRDELWGWSLKQAQK